jgi:hypothetical protein
MFPIRLQYGFHILTFPEIEVMGSNFEKSMTSKIEAPCSPRSTAARQNLQGMRSLLQFKVLARKVEFSTLLEGGKSRE